MLAAKICLTGGPSAGKTTALLEIKKHLESMGYKVYITEEAATNLMGNGIEPYGEDSISMYDFEDLVLCKQIANEYIYEKKSYLSKEKCIILCDRGIKDVRAYISSREFNELKEKYNLLNINNRYNLILHLVTPAKELKEEYTLDNNPTRKESIKEAIEKDDGCIEAWKSHPNVQMIHSFPEFQDKINKILDVIDTELNNLYVDNYKVKDDKLVKKR